MKRAVFAFSIAILFLSSNAVADRNVWIRNVTIEDVTAYNPPGYNAITVKFKIPDGQPSLNTNCIATDTYSVVSNWVQGAYSSAHQSHLSVLLSAQAQQFSVDILIDPDECSTANWGLYSHSIGARFSGVRATIK